MRSLWKRSGIRIVPTDKVIKFNGVEYDTIPDTAVFGSKWLVEAWERVGRPDSPLTEAGQKVMKAIIAVWEELEPAEAKQWYEDRKDYKLNELSITEQIHKHTGRSLASYPYMVYHMMKRMFPNFNPTKRENCMKMVSKFPIFQMANKK